jgi:hypothetical protein
VILQLCQYISSIRSTLFLDQIEEQQSPPGHLHMSQNQLPTDLESGGTSPRASLDAEQKNLSEAISGSSLPTSGPEFFELRRKQWCNAQPKETNQAPQTPDSTSHARLETVVNSPGYEYDDTIWETYLQNVNERLKGGVTLRKPLPLWIVVSGDRFSIEHPVILS